MNIKVVNKKGLISELGWTDIYVGRPGVLGNPFVMKSEADRDNVIAAYRKWLWENIKVYKGNDEFKKVCIVLPEAIAKKYNVSVATARKFGSPMHIVFELEEILKLNKVRLVCWCSPDKCHADVIKSCLEWMAGN